MKLTFGMGLDGYSPPNPTLLDEKFVGPEGLYQVVSLHIGIPRPANNQTEELLRFEDYLQSVCEGMFFQESFKRDSFSSSKVLWQWLQELVLAGWNSSKSKGETKRLEDLIKIAKFFESGENDSVAHWKRWVIREVEKCPPELQVVCLDCLDHLPTDIRLLLKALRAQQEEFVPTPLGEENTDLRLVQDAVMGRKIDGYRNDGSIVVLQSYSSHSKADWIAKEVKSDTNPAVVLSNQSEVLNLAFHRAGLPSICANSQSYARSVSRFVDLAFENMWQPINPILLLELLSLPKSPIAGRASNILAGVLYDCPGIEGEGFEKALEKRLENSTDKIRAEVVNILEMYILQQRLSNLSQISLESVTDLLATVGKWTRERRDDPDCSSTYMRISSLISLLNQQMNAGVAEVSRSRLRLFLQQVPGLQADCTVFKEVGSPFVVDDPARILMPHDTIVWWGTSMPRLYQKHGWSQREKSALEDAGCQFHEPQLGNQHLTKTWLRPILCARKKLIIVEASGDVSDVKRHPVLSHLDVLGRTQDNRPIPVPRIDVDQMISRGSWQFCQKAERLPLAQPKRYWQIAGIEVARRPVESHSSVNMFILAPYHWILERQARIRSGSLGNPYGERITLGNVGHALIQKYFDKDCQWRNESREKIVKWVEENQDETLNQLGLNLRQKGYGSTRINMIGYLSSAIKDLRFHFESADIVNVESESYLLGSFIGGEISGYADMIVTSSDGRKAILDLKLAGYSRFVNILKDFKHLQLAIYAKIIHQQSSVWPAVGYYIIEPNRLLAHDNKFFKNAIICAPRNSSIGMERLWSSFEVSWKYRRSQVDGGLIEVTGPDTPPSGDQKLPDGHLIEEYDTKFCPYRALKGFGRVS